MFIRAREGFALPREARSWPSASGEVISRALDCPARQERPCLLEALVTEQPSGVIYDGAFRTGPGSFDVGTWRLTLQEGLRLKARGQYVAKPREDSGHRGASVQDRLESGVRSPAETRRASHCPRLHREATGSLHTDPPRLSSLLWRVLICVSSDYNKTVTVNTALSFLSSWRCSSE